ncbi:MAG TPA: hypothetical protein VL485_14270 [Ktedonobacteraceae bacterium]|jgi:hypothetical protein|nr:hypothetical protein [Ktedonobacteraceae bacterium]
MTTYTFGQCIALLDIDPQLFRQWVQDDLGLDEDDLPAHADQRTHALTREQLETLAHLHHRSLPLEERHGLFEVSGPTSAHQLLMDRLVQMEQPLEQVERDVHAALIDLEKAHERISALESQREIDRVFINSMSDRLEEVEMRLQMKREIL